MLGDVAGKPAACDDAVMAAERSTVRTAAVVVVAIGWLACAAAAAGHDGVPDIQLAPSALEAGDGMTVAGDDFVTGESLALVLVGNAARVNLASVTVGRNGHFVADVTIPVDIVDGKYVVEADRSTGPVASAALVVGSAAARSGAIELIASIALAAALGVGGGLLLARRGRPSSPVVEADGGRPIDSA